MNLKKYKWKNRILLVNTPNYINSDYKKTKETYQKFIKRFHKRYIKLLSKVDKNKKFSINLIGFDGSIKKTYKLLKADKVLKTVDKMPMAKLMKKYKDIKPKNLSLYSDYNKSTTTPGLGFKNKKKAEYTIKKIKNRSMKYQISVVNTMIGRAKNHPYKNKDMKEAIKIFEKWLKKYKKSKKG